MLFSELSAGVDSAVFSSLAAADSDIINSGLLDAEGYNIDEIHMLESDPYDILVNTGVYLNLDNNKYNGDWWILSSYFPEKDTKNNYHNKCRRIRCNYKWNYKTKSFDIKYYCYTKLPKSRINHNSYSRKIMSRTDDIHVDNNTGEYYIMHAIATAPNKNRPRKLHMKFLDSSNNTYTSNIMTPNFMIFKTDYCNYSIIGTPNKQYLWILTRKYAMTPIQIKQIFIYTKNMGFNPSRLTADPSSVYMGRRKNNSQRGY